MAAQRTDRRRCRRARGLAVALGITLAATTLAGCDHDSSPLAELGALFGWSSASDAKGAKATPRATLDALFRAYGVDKLSETDVRRTLEGQGRFEIHDRALYDSVFADAKVPEDAGLGGYVFGRLVVVKDHLFVRPDGPDRATVWIQVGADQAEDKSAGAGADTAAKPTGVVLRKGDAGWQIVLRESVPEKVRMRLYDIYRRHEQQLER